MPKGTPQTITADGVIGIEDKPVVIYAIATHSTATPSVNAFHDGDAATDTLMFQTTGTASVKVLAANIPAGGIFFPNGCYVNVDANLDTGGLTVWHEVISRS